MITIDTNVLVRLLTGDDPVQTQRAAALFSQERIFIPKTVLLETEWVLRYSYERAPSTILDAFNKVLGLPQVLAEDSAVVINALAGYARGMDFADALHLASGHAGSTFATFDKRLKKRVDKSVKIKLL